MTLIFTLFLLILLHFVTGFGLLFLFSISLEKPLQKIALSVLIGIVIASLVPFILQLFFIPITETSVFASLIGVAILANIKTALYVKHLKFKPLPKVKFYELPAILLLAYMLFVSAWRCYYYPSYVRDGLSGPETIADYALKEHTLINSVFSVNLETTNNQYKSPYLTDLQIIYKMAGFPFGNVWISLIAVFFMVFLYQALCRKIHPVLAGFLCVIFLATPEAYGYTFMGLYDYGNMVFFALGTYFLYSYFESKKLNEFYFSALLYAFSVFIRSETLVLVVMMLPILALFAWKNRLFSDWKLLAKYTVLPIAGFIGYFIPVEIYNNHYLPTQYNTNDLINTNLMNLQPLWHRFSYMTSELIFGERGAMLWNGFFYIFIVMLLAELLIKRHLSKDSGNWLYAVLVIYAGLPILGFLLPLMDLDNTTKRGLFKILPLIIFYLASNSLIGWISEKMYAFEYNSSDKKQAKSDKKQAAVRNKSK